MVVGLVMLAMGVGLVIAAPSFVGVERRMWGRDPAADLTASWRVRLWLIRAGGVAVAAAGLSVLLA